MTEEVKFVYEKEYWYVSALINSEKIELAQKKLEITELIRNKLRNLNDEDLVRISYDSKLVNQVKAMGKNLDIQCEWSPILDQFPYYDENKNLKFNTLGYFKFEVERYPNDGDNKKKISPISLQQLPIQALNELKIFCTKYTNQYILLDLESPIFVWVTSKKTNKDGLTWTQENIEKYKQEIGTWTEIYSGQWADYSESLYESRISGNLSNRLSELHYIKRNSGFIYMADDNYNRFFNGYMIQYVLNPTALVRSIVFAVLSLNKALDILFKRAHSERFDDIEFLDQKIKNLKYLRGMIQSQLTSIYDELDYNRRQHYTSVLTHLIKEFNLGELMNRINLKFELIYDSMQLLYQKKNEENQKTQQKSMNLLQKFFGLNVLFGLFAAIDSVATATNPVSRIIKLIPVVICLSVLGVALIIYAQYKKKLKQESIIYAVDAVIMDKNNNVVMITRKYPPFQGLLALPGGMIEEKETPEKAIIREVKEETNLDVKIIREIGVYDEKYRDPRGRIVSRAFLCSCEDVSEIKSQSDAKTVELIPIEKLQGIDLAFDHELILEDALKKD